MGACCSSQEEEQHISFSEQKPSSNDLHAIETFERHRTPSLVRIPPVASWPTHSHFASSMVDTSCRSSMKTEEDFMDGASERKLSNASGSSSNSTRVDEYCHYGIRSTLSQPGSKEYFPVEITLGDDMNDPSILADFSWMQRPVNTFPVPMGKHQTDRDNVVHYIMRYVMNGFHTAPLRPKNGQGGRILDIGSGSGIWAIEVAKAYPNFLEGLMFNNETFDYIFVRNMTVSMNARQCLMLELGDQGYQDVVDDAYRILKPGGYLEIVEPSMQLRNAGPVTQRFQHLHNKAFEYIGVNTQLANMLPMLINTSMFATQASTACTWTVAIPVGKRWRSRIARLMAMYLLAEFRACKNMLCSVATLSEADYDEVMAAVKEELLTVTDTHIIWRTVLAQKPPHPR
ncbi:hypothetical protein INT43_004363 [Umbelopsis isabellina]|uniref:Methyltransferase domain-containing protein n=1 Tax=Mortierella isabellina TaxID=91625 RepID=A0A8H7PIG0_MORIS|nr:hypothetical protein INT43_004363 [Umbelopsis isabellina]